MGVTFSTVPAGFGPAHLAILAVIAAATVALYFILKRLSEQKLIRLLFLLGAAMLVLEIWKQWFVYRYVYGGTLSAWFFPWQLCSIAMYLSFLMPLLKGRAQDTALVFLATFSFLAAVVALVFPGDMLRPQILLFCHGFLYHGAMVVESLIAALILLRREKAPFLPSVWLFLALAAVAEIINVVSHALFSERKMASNMFNITPYYPSTQPVFHEIAVSLGILPEILIYLALIILGSWGLYRLLYGVGKRKKA